MTDRSNTTILIVDDDGPILMALQLRLEHVGYKVITAKDPTSACVKARNENPDVALLDINLPGGDGFMLADQLDRLGNKIMPKVFITASKRPEFKQEAYRKGAVQFIEKPFTADRIFDALQDAVDMV